MTPDPAASAAQAFPARPAVHGSDGAAHPDEPTAGPCAFTPTPDEPAARPVAPPPDPRSTSDQGYARVVLQTNRGDIPLVLDRAKAPCTVQSFLNLARRKFYDQTTCQRLTAYPTLSVLQCGDPRGTGDRAARR